MWVDVFFISPSYPHPLFGKKVFSRIPLSWIVSEEEKRCKQHLDKVDRQCEAKSVEVDEQVAVDLVANGNLHFLLYRNKFIRSAAKQGTCSEGESSFSCPTNCAIIAQCTVCRAGKRRFPFGTGSAKVFHPASKVKHIAGSGPSNLPCLGCRYTTDKF